MLSPRLAHLMAAMVFLPLVPAAQDPAPARTSVPLVVKTGHPRIAAGLSMGDRQGIPDLQAGQHYVMTMSADGELAVTAGNGAVPFIVIEARPRALMEIFAEHVEEARRIAKATASVGAAGSGMRPAQMANMMDAIFDFPLQVEVLTVTVDGDEERGWDARAEVVPLPGSGFERVVARLRPSEKGVPQIGDGAVTMAADLHPSIVKEIFMGLGELVAGMVDEADRPALRAMMADQAAASDGTMAFAMQAGPMVMLFGCSDSEAMRKLMAGDQWTKMQRAFLASMPDAEIEITREKVGDLEVLHSRGDLGTTDNPFTKDGKLEGWTTVAGDAMVSVTNGTRKAFDDLVAAAAAGKLARAPLPGGSVMTMRIDMAAMLALQGQDAPPGMPATLDLRLGRKAKSTLSVDVRVGM